MAGGNPYMTPANWKKYPNARNQSTPARIRLRMTELSSQRGVRPIPMKSWEF